MTEQTQEPTMEEILASIRRIISEDEPGQAPAAPEAAAAEPEPAPEAPVVQEEVAVAAAVIEPEPEPVVEEEPLELTNRFEEPEAVGDIEAFPAPVESEPAPIAPVAPIAAAITHEIGGGLTVEAMVRSIVEPQVQAWLSQNLDGLLREMLREKLERVFR